MESAKQIEARAAAWLSQRDNSDWNEADEARLRAWLEEATAHRIAFLRLKTVWEETNRLKALAAGLPPDSGEKMGWTLPFFDPRQQVSATTQLAAEVHDYDPPATRAGGGRRSYRHAGMLAFAASALLALGVFYFGYHRTSADHYDTQVGVISLVPLQDGSSITLNTASKVRVELNERERYVDLTEGEAFFEVAKDVMRPFVVAAGDERIVAVGTQFSVRRDEHDVRIVVTEGTVRVESLSDRSGNVLLPAGTIASIRDGAVLLQTKPIPQTEEVLSWRTGYLTFRDTPLEQAIREFNQYNHQQMVTSDPALAEISLSGKFKATNCDAFVRLLEDGYAVRARREGATIMLSR